jgi:hypothetical protein
MQYCSDSNRVLMHSAGLRFRPALIYILIVNVDAPEIRGNTLVESYPSTVGSDLPGAFFSVAAQGGAMAFFRRMLAIVYDVVKLHFLYADNLIAFRLLWGFPLEDYYLFQPVMSTPKAASSTMEKRA